MTEIVVGFLLVFGGYVIGSKCGSPIDGFKSWSASRALTKAKAIIAKAEADAKALETARKIVASTPST